jgi:hypothetical protein
MLKRGRWDLMSWFSRSSASCLVPGDDEVDRFRLVCDEGDAGSAVLAQVGVNPAPEVPGLASVDGPALGVPDEVNARRMRQLLDHLLVQGHDWKIS